MNLKISSEWKRNVFAFQQNVTNKRDLSVFSRNGSIIIGICATTSSITLTQSQQQLAASNRNNRRKIIHANTIIQSYIQTFILEHTLTSFLFLFSLLSLLFRLAKQRTHRSIFIYGRKIQSKDTDGENVWERIYEIRWDGCVQNISYNVI